MLKTQSPKLICDTRPSVDQASHPCFLKSKLCPSSSSKNLALPVKSQRLHTKQCFLSLGNCVSLPSYHLVTREIKASSTTYHPAVTKSHTVSFFHLFIYFLGRGPESAALVSNLAKIPLLKGHHSSGEAHPAAIPLGCGESHSTE